MKASGTTLQIPLLLAISDRSFHSQGLDQASHSGKASLDAMLKVNEICTDLEASYRLAIC
jgi:hypothetical protein